MRKLVVLALAACGHSSVMPDDASPDVARDVAIDTPAPIAPLEIHGLGVQGFVLRWGHDAVMTAPLFTRQSVHWTSR